MVGVQRTCVTHTAGSGKGQGLYLEVYKAARGSWLTVMEVMCPLREMTLVSSELRLP